MKMDSNHIYVQLPYDAKDIAKNILNGTWSRKQMAWRFPKSTYALDEIAHHFPPLTKTVVWQDVYTKLTEGRRRLKELKKQPNTEDTPNTKGLRPYQQQDIQYLTSIPNAGIFNQPRTGKTPTMIRTIRKRRTMRNVIICPASLQYNWKKEIETWHPSATVHMYTGTPKQRQQQLDEFHAPRIYPAYIIMSKDTAKRDVEDLAKYSYDTCVVDEAHYLRNSDTKQSQAVYTLGYLAKHRYALTGTPTVKHPADIFGILKFLYPHKFTSYWQFVERYFHVDDNGWGKVLGKPKKHRVEELQDLIDAMSTQRLRKEVMDWLPDKTRHTHLCHMDTKQRKLYKEMLDDFFIKNGDMEIDAQNVLAQLTRLRQICIDPALIGLNSIASAKTDALIEAIEDGTYSGTEPVIIMSMFTSYLHQLKPKIEKLEKRVAMITGDMSAKEKDNVARSFQAGEIDVLLCNIISAGTGFTLDKGEVIIFTDKAWNPSDNEQAEDRITPTQTTRNHKHFIVSFVCENSIEEKINALLDNKQSLTAIINENKTMADLKNWLLY